jgi:hypothetical protein
MVLCTSKSAEACMAFLKNLAQDGYTPTANTPGPFTHMTCPIAFSLVVDDFGVKYVGRKHAEHIVATLQSRTPSPPTGPAPSIVVSAFSGTMMPDCGPIHAGLHQEGPHSLPAHITHPRATFAIPVDTAKLWGTHPAHPRTRRHPHC